MPVQTDGSPAEPLLHADALVKSYGVTRALGAAKERGAAVVLVTHEPRIARYADREAVVRDGRVSWQPTLSVERHPNFSDYAIDLQCFPQ